MDDIFETCLEHVMDMNCVIEGTFMAKMIEKAGEKKSDDDIRKTLDYKSVYTTLKKTDGKYLKEFKEKLKNAKEIINKSEEKYLSKSTARQIIETLTISGFIDMSRIQKAMITGQIVDKKGLNSPGQISVYKAAMHAFDLAVKDFEAGK